MKPTDEKAYEERCEIYEASGYWEPLALGEQLRGWAERFGDRVALVEKERRLTYRELDTQADELAAGFLGLGIQKGDHVVVQLPNTIGFALTCFALFRLGAVPVLSMPAHREAELDGIFSVAKPVAYIIPDTFLGFDYAKMAAGLKERHPSVRFLITDGEGGGGLSLADLPRPPLAMDPPWYRDTALLLLSGGTTGTPKLIPRTHTDYAYNAKASAKRCRFDGDTVYLAVLPVAHNFPLASPGLLGTLSVGGRVVFSQTTSYDEAFPLIEKERVTITALVPAIVNIWLQALEWDTSDLSSLELLQVGGSPLDERLAARVMPEMGCRLQQVFGMAEGLLCYTSPDDPESVLLSCQGRPLCEHDEIRLVDENGEDVPDGEFGELLVRGPYTITGYYRAPEQNLGDFTPDGFYRSGDKARWTPEGNIQVRGRIKEQINRAGEKIMAAEVESCLNGHPEIDACAIVAVPDEHLGERSCAFVITSNPGLTLREIHEFFAQKGVARYKMPDQLEFANAWPLTSVGKINKKALARTAAETDREKTDAYHETALPFHDDPLLTAAQIVESGMFDDWLLYENRHEWSLGLGVRALLAVDWQKTKLTMGNLTHCFENNDLSETIDKALSLVPIHGWRAYGTANFELSRYNLSLEPASGEKNLMKLFIPEAEVRFSGDSVVLRALDTQRLDRLIDLFGAIVNKNQEESIKTDIRERVARQKLPVPEIETHDSENYRRIVACAVDEIREPQYQKVILSRKIPLSRDIDMVASYIAGREANTPARSFLLQLEGLKAAGFSPETVVEVDAEGMVGTQPLAGTRSTGTSRQEERQLREELVNDSKEIAEHAISVKLAFEEMLMVCDPQTISVTDFMAVARRGTVQHLASRLKGKLKQGCNPWHAFNALFPAVTASGIPKKEAIDSIGRLEDGPRHLYSGCIMTYDSNGTMDAALVLRSFFQEDNKTWLQAGAGIVDMSVPSRELEETREKLRSVSRQLVCA